MDSMSQKLNVDFNLQHKDDICLQLHFHLTIKKAISSNLRNTNFSF
jgi:hypothetical protein